MRFTSRPDAEPSLIPEDQARRCLLMAGLGVITLLASFAYAPWAHTGPVLCPTRWLAGVPCPGCGLTRSFCAMTHGDWIDALGWHLLGPGLFVALLVGVPILAFQGFTRRPLPVVHRILYSRAIGWTLAIILILYHAARLTEMIWTGTLWTAIRGSAAVAVLHWIFG